MTTFKIGSITDALDAEVELKHPGTGVGLGAFVRLAGPEHPTRKALMFSRARKMRAALQRVGRVEIGDPEEEFDESLERLSQCVLGWRGIEGDAGPLAFSTGAARALLGDPGNAWIREQLQLALDQREVFIRTSASA